MSDVEFKTPISDEERQRLADAYNNEPCYLLFNGFEMH